MTTTTDTDIAIDPDSEWEAIHCTLDGTRRDPKANDWQTRWPTAMDSLRGVTLDDTLRPQTIEPAKGATQTYHRTTKHSVGHYPTTIHPEAVFQIKGAPSLDPPDTHSAQQQSAFTTYWSFSTAAGMVPQVAQPAALIAPGGAAPGASMVWDPLMTHCERGDVAVAATT